MKYIIKDENGETMRIVGRREEARYITKIREGWTFKGVRSKRIDFSKFEDALI